MRKTLSLISLYRISLYRIAFVCLQRRIESRAPLYSYYSDHWGHILSGWRRTRDARPCAAGRDTGAFAHRYQLSWPPENVKLLRDNQAQFALSKVLSARGLGRARGLSANPRHICAASARCGKTSSISSYCRSLPLPAKLWTSIISTANATFWVNEILAPSKLVASSSIHLASIIRINSASPTWVTGQRLVLFKTAT